MVLKGLRFKESADIILIAVVEVVCTVKFPACQKEKERKKEMKLSEVSCALPTQQYKKQENYVQLTKRVMEMTGLAKICKEIVSLLAHVDNVDLRSQGPRTK